MIILIKILYVDLTNFPVTNALLCEHFSRNNRRLEARNPTIHPGDELQKGLNQPTLNNLTQNTPEAIDGFEVVGQYAPVGQVYDLQEYLILGFDKCLQLKQIFDF